jgi:hypothetical protein
MSASERPIHIHHDGQLRSHQIKQEISSSALQSGHIENDTHRHGSCLEGPFVVFDGVGDLICSMCKVLFGVSIWSYNHGPCRKAHSELLSKVLSFPSCCSSTPPACDKVLKALRRWNNFCLCLHRPKCAGIGTVRYGNGLVYLFPGHLCGLDFC